MKPFFLHKKSQHKNLNILRTKGAFKMKALFIIFKGLLLKQIKLFFEGGSPTLKRRGIFIIISFHNPLKLITFYMGKYLLRVNHESTRALSQYECPWKHWDLKYLALRL